MLFTTLLTADTINVTNGLLGVALDSLIVRCETIVWGGTTATGQVYPSAAGQMIGVATALGAIFAICVAAKMAYKMMTDGEGIDVLKLMRPIFIAFVLANWYSVCGGLHGLVRPFESGFKGVYVWSHERVDSLRFRRDTLAQCLHGEIDAVKAEVLISEIRTRYGVTDEDEEEAQENQPIDGTLTDYNAQVSYNAAEFGDVLYDELHKEPLDGKPEVDIGGLMEQASMFSWVEVIIQWLAETIWGATLYFIFLIKYLYLYVLIMFGPIWMACSILDTWKDSWSEWISKFIVVGLYGMAAYVVLIFGMMIIEYTVNADIHVFEKALLNEDNFISYLQKASRVTGLSSVGMYFIALLVTAVALPGAFSLAELAFPGEVGRGAAEFVAGVHTFIVNKLEQAKELAEEVAVVVLTGGTGHAAYKEYKEMEKFMDEMEGGEDDEMATYDKRPSESEERRKEEDEKSKTKSSSKPDSSKSEKKRSKPDWIADADEEERKEAERKRKWADMYDVDDPMFKVMNLSDDAYKWADRQAYMAVMGTGYQCSREDLAAELRDQAVADKAEQMGIRTEYEEFREARLRENKFLWNIVKARAQTNSQLTDSQKKLISQLGITEAMRRDPSLKKKLLHGLPRLTSKDALFGRDTVISSAEQRKILKEMGLYKHAQRAEFLRRLANSFIRKNAVYNEKIFFFTWQTKDKTFRNSMHRSLYMKCINDLEKTEALIALRARQILAERDIHVDASGKPVRLRGMAPYWREDIDLESYMQAVEKDGNAQVDDEYMQWFVHRYDTMDKARRMMMELEVFEAKKRADDADDFVLEHQLKATDDFERELWGQMNQDAKVFMATKRHLEALMRHYGSGKT